MACSATVFIKNPMHKNMRVKSCNEITPYQKLKSLPDAKNYLKSNMTFETLDKKYTKLTYTSSGSFLFWNILIPYFFDGVMKYFTIALYHTL